MLFISGRLSLDFAHSGGEGQFAAFERLHSGKDLREWLRLSSLGLTGASVQETDLVPARRLRRAIWILANELRENRPPSARELSALNRMAGRPSLAPVWRAGANLEYARPATAEQALSSIARDAIRLFASGIRIHKCANPRCPLLFVDLSRPGKRRWCAMERCGNMSKTSRHRQRAATGSGGCDGSTACGPRPSQG